MSEEFDDDDNEFSYSFWVEQHRIMQEKRNELQRKLDIAVEALNKLEWIRDEFTGVTGGMCHICGGYKTKSGLHPGEFAGHKDTCIFVEMQKWENTK